MTTGQGVEAAQAEAQPVSQPAWQTVVLVCKACTKRSGAPKKMKAKAVVSQARLAARAAGHRPRVLVTSCLGLCPKRAVAIGAAGAPNGARVAALASMADVQACVGALLAPAPRAAAQPQTAARARL